MSETPEEDIARFSYPRNATGGKRRLLIDYRHIVVRVEWPDTDKGRADLSRFVTALPELLESAQGEMDVLNQMRDFESEVEDLFNREDEK